MNEYDAVIYHVEQTIDRKLEDDEKKIFLEIFDKGIELGANTMAISLNKEHAKELRKYGDEIRKITENIDKELVTEEVNGN